LGISFSFLRLGREQQRITLIAARLGRIGCLGFGDILRIDGDDTHTALMGRDHHARRACSSLMRNSALRTVTTNARGRIVVVDQGDSVKRWTFDLNLVFDIGLDDAVTHRQDALLKSGGPFPL
jgi:hypothetical protein